MCCVGVKDTLLQHPSGAVKAQKIFTASHTLNGPALLVLLQPDSKTVLMWEDERVSVFWHISCLLFFSICYCKESGIRAQPVITLVSDWPFARLNFNSCSASWKSPTPEVDPGDVKLYGCHNPLDRGKSTDMSKTNLLHKQEVSERWWEKVVGRPPTGL